MDKTLLRAEDEGACEMRTVFFTGATGGLGTSCQRTVLPRLEGLCGSTNDDKLRARRPSQRGPGQDRRDGPGEHIHCAGNGESSYGQADAVPNFAGLTSFTSMIGRFHCSH